MINDLKIRGKIALTLNCIIGLLFIRFLSMWNGFEFDLPTLYCLIPLFYAIILICLRIIRRFVKLKTSNKLYLLLISIINLNPTLFLLIIASVNIFNPIVFVIWVIELLIILNSVYTIYLIIRKKISKKFC